MRFEKLQSERLDLLPVHRDLAAGMFEGLQSPELYAFMNKEPPATVQSLADHYAQLAGAKSPDGRETWLNWILQSRDDRHFIGFVQATVRERRASVGYIIFAGAWGRGYASEGLAAMLRALRDDGIEEFIATVHAENHKSMRVLERAGFTVRTLLRNAETIRGVSTDDYEFGMLAAAVP